MIQSGRLISKYTFAMTYPTQRRFAVLATACALTLSAATRPALAQPAGDFFFHDGDRAVILGDSITQQHQYSTLIESYVLSRFPNWKITFRNSGWGGDTMGLRQRGGLDNGFTRDIAPLKPTAVTIDFGMNDVRALDAGYEPYLTNTRTLADKFAGIGTRVAFVTSSPEEKYEAEQPAGSAYNLMLRKYSQGLQGVAQEKKVLFIDQLNPMISVIEAGRKAGVLTPDGKVRLINDNVHPGWAGHLIMATAILKGLGASSLVSSVEINAGSGEVKTEKAKVSEVKTGDTLSFVRQDDAMPWPMPGEVALAMKIPGFTPHDDLSRYLLKVTNLAAAKYKVSLDGKELGTFTKDELATGVNLSYQAGAIMPETTGLLKDILAKNQTYFHLWRDLQLFSLPGVMSWIPLDAIEPARQAEIKKQEAQLADMDAKLNQPRTPKPHTWTLTPAN